MKTWKPFRLVGLGLAILLIGHLALVANAASVQQPCQSPVGSRLFVSRCVDPTPASDDVLVLTLADQGRTVVLTVGQQLGLDLGSSYDWLVQIADETVVSLVPDDPTRYQASQPGQTTLTAAGNPPCRKSTPPCMRPSRLFQVQLVVQPASEATQSATTTLVHVQRALRGGMPPQSGTGSPSARILGSIPNAPAQLVDPVCT